MFCFVKQYSTLSLTATEFNDTKILDVEIEVNIHMHEVLCKSGPDYMQKTFLFVLQILISTRQDPLLLIFM